MSGVFEDFRSPIITAFRNRHGSRPAVGATHPGGLQHHSFASPVNHPGTRPSIFQW